mmetsp:Transcript_12910/g.1972  ORF Transcript_12910/g.1972 Transcript_12910/m.1972 type:complete len:92 (-) Transcript_12910:3581-3856(-)
MPALTPGGFVNPLFLTTHTGYGYVNVTFEFRMQPDHLIPSGGTVEIILPSGQFILHNSSPVPTCTVTGLVGQNSSDLSCRLYGNTVTLTNF